jgi:hypothetical protein
MIGHTENDSIIPVDRNPIPVRKTELKNAKLPSSVLPVNEDHLLLPIRLPTIEA